MVKKESQQAASKYRPKVGDKVICDHNGVLYEAKILTTRTNNDTAEESYYVHYQGWSKNWDEWVTEQRLFKFNETNEALMVQSKSALKGKGSTKKKGNTSISSTNTSLNANNSLVIEKPEEKEIKPEKEAKEKKGQVSATKPLATSASSIKTESILEDLELKRLKPEVKIRIPDELKNWLIDDDDNIKNKKLSILPARLTISAVLKDFVNFKKTTSKLSLDKEISLNECMLGLKYAFNVMVGAHLLYKFERPQYQNILKEHGKDADLTTLYGPVHLVRMLTKIGAMMAFTTLDNKDVHVIINHILDIMKYLKKQNNLFDVDKSYQIAPPEYIRQYQRAVD